MEKEKVNSFGDSGFINQSYYYLPSSFDKDGNTVADSAMIETSEDLVLHQDAKYRSDLACFYVGKNSSLYVYGDKVTIRGKIEAPGRTIRIFCRELDVDPAGAAIVVDGEPGDAHNDPPAAAAAGSSAQDATRKQREGQDGATGAEGRPGGKGGEIAIVCGHFTKRATLSLSANGGKGGNGQKGQPGGRGGAGARGKDWVHYATPHENHPQRPKRILFAIRGGEGGKGGWGGRGGIAGVGGKGGGVIISGASDLVLGSAAPGPNGDPGEGGKGGDGGTGGPPGQPALPGIRGPGCYDWKYKGTYGEQGETGASLGKGEARPDWAWALEALDAARRGVRAQQLRANAPPSRYSPGGRTEELFQDAVLDAVLTFENKGFQVAGNRTMHGGNYAVEFEEILKNMQDVCRECGGAGTVWVNDPKNFPKVRVLEFVHVSQLRMVFHKARMHYLAAGEVLDGASELDSEFDKAKVLLTWLNETLEDVINVADPNSQVAGQAQSLMRRVLSLLDYIGMGLNYFGKEPAYVPRQSLAQYERWLNESLAVLFSIEGHHGKLYEELKGKTKLTLHLAKCASVIDGQKTLCGGQRKRIVKEMALAVSSIADAGTVVANARTATRDAIEKYRIDIENQVKSPDSDKLLGMLEMVAFIPEGPLAAAMAGAQAGRLLTTLNTAFTEVETAGGSYKKEYIVHKMEGLGEDFQSFDDGIRIAGDDSLKMSDERKLLTTQEKLKDALNTFYSKHGVSGKPLQRAMDYYVRQVLQRNDKVMEYNQLLRQWQDLNARIRELDAKQWVGNTQQADVASPGMPMMMAFVDGLYEHAKDQCLDDLYKAARAYAFWSLEDDFSVFTSLLGNKHPHEVNHAILVAGKEEVLKQLRATLEKSARPPQQSGAKMIYLNKEPAVLEMLKKTGVATFKLPPARKETREEDPELQAKFHGMADVRLTKLRAWAYFLTDSFVEAADLLFPSGGYQLSPAGRAELSNNIVPKLTGLQNAKVVVYGYTDNEPVGPQLQEAGINDNLTLSSRRAGDVVTFLISQGVNPHIISAKGFGDTHPLAPNDTPADRAKNRRIVITVQGPGNGHKFPCLVLTHLGDDTLVTVDNQERTFRHVPVETTIIYLAAAMPAEDLDPGNDAVDRIKHTNVQDGDIKDLQELSDKRVFSEIGPFGAWKIEIPDRDNSGLKLSTLKDVRIDFYCTSHTLQR